jgi:hypothetical protein
METVTAALHKYEWGVKEPVFSIAYLDQTYRFLFVGRPVLTKPVPKPLCFPPGKMISLINVHSRLLLL